MSRLPLLTLCLVLFCVMGCSGETPTAVNPEVPEAGAEETFQVLLNTTKGNVTLEVHPEWSPKGAARFKELVELGFYDDVAFFRVIDGFMAQVGVNGDPELHAKWKDNNIMDDPVIESNKRGYVTFAKTGFPNSRSTQFFINFKDNSRLDRDGFAPFAKVIEGMDVVDSLYNGYGEGAPAPGGKGPRQDVLVQRGNAYLKSDFPMLDYIKKAVIVGGSPKAKTKSDTAAPAVNEDKKPTEPAAEKKKEAEPKSDKKAAEKEPAKKAAEKKEPVKKEPAKKEN